MGGQSARGENLNRRKQRGLRERGSEVSAWKNQAADTLGNLHFMKVDQQPEQEKIEQEETERFGFETPE